MGEGDLPGGRWIILLGIAGAKRFSPPSTCTMGIRIVARNWAI